MDTINFFYLTYRLSRRLLLDLLCVYYYLEIRETGDSANTNKLMKINDK